jgi:hypothetical protein
MNRRVVDGTTEIFTVFLYQGQEIHIGGMESLDSC